MSRLAEVLQAVVALVIVAGDIYLHMHGLAADGFDTFAGVIVAFYFGGKVVQTVQANQGGATGASLPATRAGAGSTGQTAVKGASVPTVSTEPAAGAEASGESSL